MTISRTRGLEGARVISWEANHQQIVKHYQNSASGVVLKDQCSVLLIEPINRPDNAVIYNEDGSEKRRIKNPLGERGAFGFTEGGYEGQELTLIIRIPGSEFAYVLDEQGNPKAMKEIR